MRIQVKNPLMGLDYPDPDVIRVDDTYYMVSTTMHFMPGCEILRSYDLYHWEHAAFVYDRLDSTEAQRLEGKKNIYGKGMWAASLRHHKGTFYICFVGYDTGKTYLYTAERIEGPWKKGRIEGFYHDCSLLFDEDDKVYIAYGNRNIYITQLKPDLSGPLEGGLHRLAVSDKGNPFLGYEGSHFYKLNGKYYLFLIHSLRDRWMRAQACFVADSPEGEFRGGDVLADDMDCCGQGVAQGGIVDTPDGKWYSVLFQDRGAAGRIPVLVPVTWEKGWPLFGAGVSEGVGGPESGRNRKAPVSFPIVPLRPDYVYEPLVQSDDFRKLAQNREQEMRFGCFGLKSVWQFNHEPDLSLLRLDRRKGILWVGTDRLCGELTSAKNMITTRMLYPGCEVEVTVDGSFLNEGDYGGICALQGRYGMAALTKRNGQCRIVMRTEREWETVDAVNSRIRLKLAARFLGGKDEVDFFYYQETEKRWRKIGITHKLIFGLDHFTGCRIGLFFYSTRETGGKAGFRDFLYTAG